MTEFEFPFSTTISKHSNTMRSAYLVNLLSVGLAVAIPFHNVDGHKKVLHKNSTSKHHAHHWGTHVHDPPQHAGHNATVNCTHMHTPSSAPDPWSSTTATTPSSSREHWLVESTNATNSTSAEDYGANEYLASYIQKAWNPSNPEHSPINLTELVLLVKHDREKGRKFNEWFYENLRHWEHRQEKAELHKTQKTLTKAINLALRGHSYAEVRQYADRAVKGSSESADSLGEYVYKKTAATYTVPKGLRIHRPRPLQSQIRRMARSAAGMLDLPHVRQLSREEQVNLCTQLVLFDAHLIKSLYEKPHGHDSTAMGRTWNKPIVEKHKANHGSKTHIPGSD